MHPRLGKLHRRACRQVRFSPYYLISEICKMPFLEHNKIGVLIREDSSIRLNPNFAF
jgi:hypothetical protein